jgi:hypothetical protein
VKTSVGHFGMVDKNFRKNPVVKKVFISLLSNQQEQQLRKAFDLLIAELVRTEIRQRKERAHEKQQ